MRFVASLGILFCLLAPPAQAQLSGNLEEALRNLPPEQQDIYRQQLLRFERVARRLVQAVPNPPQVNFLLAARESSINAGATFGKVIVSEGMMRFVRSDDELAMILGHELAHLTEGHVSRGAVSNTLLGLGSAIVGTLFPGGDIATGLVGQMVINRFNQDQEREADQVGLRYVYQAGYDPQTAVQVMQRMAEEVPETASAGFFSSHPSSVERFATLQRMAAEMSQRPEARRAASSIPDRQSQGQRNETACRRAKPYFYRAADTTKLREKISLYRQGLRICPASPRAHAELADAYARSGDQRQAAAELRAVLQYDPDYPGARQRLRELETRLSRRS